MKPIKLAIYLGDYKGSEIDATDVESGNPGIGGTQYCMLQLAHFLNASEKYEVSVYSNRPCRLEEGINFRHCAKFDDVIPLGESENMDMVIVHDFSTPKLQEDIKRTGLKVIAWCHNYPHSDIADFLAATKQISAVVFVGKQMYDRYIDHDIIRKSTFIHNMFSDHQPLVSRPMDNHDVVYMGSITNGKGFRELCSIWPGIVREVPDARLIVLGSGQLYGDARLGKYGIAEESYENSFMRYISDRDGKILPSVVFKGIVGSEKSEIFRNSAVGVVNPSGKTETFGMGIVEMAQASMPTVTIGKNGHFDTVINGQTGILGRNLKGVQRGIIRLLQDREANLAMGKSAKEFIRNFAPANIMPRWERLISDVGVGILSFPYIEPVKPFSNNQKWARVFLRSLRFNVGLRFVPPLISVETAGAKIIRSLRKIR